MMRIQMQYDICLTSVASSKGEVPSDRIFGPDHGCRIAKGSQNTLTMEYSDLIPVVQWRGGSHTTSFNNATAAIGGHAHAGASQPAGAESGLTNGGRI